MTIGIGFDCLDGIVIAADTQYTRGEYKGHGPKTFNLFATGKRSDLAVVIAGAGSVALMKRAVQKIETALAVTTFALGLTDVQTIIEKELDEFFKTYIYPSPGNPKDIGFVLLVGAWTKTEGFGLFQTEGIVANRVANYGSATIGMGFSVAEYALSLTYQSGISVESAKFVAAFCIKAAKDKVDYCGGKTHLWTMKGDHSGCLVEEAVPADLNDAEQYSDDLFDQLRCVLTFLDPEPALDADSVREITDAIKDSVLEFRNKRITQIIKRREAKERHEALLAKIRARKLTPPVS